MSKARDLADGNPFTPTDETKLDGISAGADVTSDALSGLTTETSLTGSDIIPIYDTANSVWKKATVTDAALQGPQGADGTFNNMLRLGTQTAKSYTSDTGSHTWYYTDGGQVMTGYLALWAWGDDMIGGMRQRPVQYHNGSSWVTVSDA